MHIDKITKNQEIAKRFDSVADIYADNYTNGSFVSYFFKQRLGLVLKLLDNYSQATILDVGCGPGIMAEYCIQKNFEFYGVDISERMINVCLSKFGHKSSTHFSVGKLQKLEFSKSFFDVVLCMGALEYVEPDEVDLAILEMARVLKPNGLMIISLLNKNSFYERDKRVWESALKRFGKLNHDEEIAHLFDKKGFCKLLNKCQLIDIESTYFGLNIFPFCLAENIPVKIRVLISKGLDQIIGNRLKWAYTAFLIKATKKM